MRPAFTVQTGVPVVTGQIVAVSIVDSRTILGASVVTVPLFAADIAELAAALTCDVITR